MSVVGSHRREHSRREARLIVGMHLSDTLRFTALACVFVLCRLAAADGPATIALDLEDGSYVVGSTELASIAAKASYGKMDIALHRILSVTISNDHETALFHLRNGDRVRGTLDGKPMVVKTGFGTVTAPIKHVKAIQVYRGPAPPAGFRKNLVLHLTFDKEQGLTVPDNSGNGNDGEAIRGNWTAEGQSGGGHMLDGKNDYIRIASDAAFAFGSGNFTIGLWLKASTVTAPKKKTQVIIAKYQAQVGCQWSLTLTDKGMLKLTTASKPERGWEQSKTSKSNTMKNGTWHHVAVRKFRREAVFYVDGRPLAEDDDRVGNVGGGDEPVRIGAYKNREGRLDGFLGGTVDDVMIWRRALSEEEIRWLAGVRPEKRSEW